MRALIVIPHWLDPPDSGLKWLTFCILREVCTAVECDLIGLDLPSPGTQLRFAGGFATVIGSFRRSGWLLGQRIQEASRLRPIALASFRSAVLAQSIGRVKHRYDLIHYDHINMCQYLEGDVASVIVAPDAYSQAYEREANASLEPGERAIARYRAWATKRFERTSYRAASTVMAVSKEECHYLAAVTGREDIEWLPMPVAEEFFDGMGHLPSAQRALTSGHFGASGLREGLTWYVREVHPLVRARVPSAVMSVCGFDIGEGLRSELSSSPGIEILGAVDDYRGLLRQASIYVAPQKSGSGLKNRILQAMAMGVPVVGTPTALRGIAYEDGPMALVGDTPAEFAEAVVALLLDRQRSTVMAERAHAMVRRCHHPTVAGAAVLRAYEHALAHHGMSRDSFKGWQLKGS